MFKHFNSIEDLAFLFNQLDSFVFVKDIEEFRFCFINTATANLLGDTVENIIGKTDYDYFPKEIADDFREKDLNVIKSNEVQKTPLEKVSSQDSGTTWVRTTKKIITVDNKKYILGIAEDISFYIQQQNVLVDKINQIHKEQSFLQDTLDRLPGVFYSKDLDGNFLYVNRHFNNLIDKTNEEIVGKNQFELFPDYVANQFRETDLEIIKNKKDIEFVEESNGADGNDHYWHSFKFPYIDENGEVFATGGISLDITEKSNLEKQNLQNSKLAAIGQMAASVSHEINNPLTIIQGLIFKLQKGLEHKAPTLADDFACDFQKVKSSTARITRIIQALRTFSQKDVKNQEHFDIVGVCHEIMDLVSDVYSNERINVNFNNELESDRFLIFGNNGNIQQAIMNLVANAKDALMDSETKKIDISLKADTSHLLIEVSDTGPGIPTELHEKIFDAFYSTKDVNNGTGLGISTSLSIAKTHKGDLKLIKSDSEGTCFCIKLPLDYRD